MKRLLITLTSIIASLIIFTSCEKNENITIEYSALPSAAKSTISTHFDIDQIMLITYDKQLLDKEYTVSMFDGTIIEFDKDGAWESIDSITTGVPTSILHTKIAEYLLLYYDGQNIISLDKDISSYEVKLENLIELEFNLSGVLIGVDID